MQKIQHLPADRSAPKAWVKPVVQRLRAGSAELLTGTLPDGPDDS